MTMLKRHLATDLGLTPADYRARWKLPADYPLVAPNYAEKAPRAREIDRARAEKRRPTKPAAPDSRRTLKIRTGG